MKLLIVGSREGTNVGGSFERAARRIGLEAKLLDTKRAWAGPRLLRSISWRLLDRKPPGFRRFNEEFLAMSNTWKPDVVLCTGMAPLSADALNNCGPGVLRANFLTDDPWSESRGASWFLKALAKYDVLFTPRRANVPDLSKVTQASIVYLRFGFDEDLFQPDPQPIAQRRFADVIFAGGADKDRVPYIAGLKQSGMQVALYGSYWTRFQMTKPLSRGQIGTKELNRAIASARLGLCLVRRSNRDGHCMRTFELPAVGVPMLVEDTDDHRDIFGREWDSAVYFRDVDTLVEKANFLLQNSTRCEVLMRTAHDTIIAGGHTYTRRLSTILSNLGAQPQGM